MNKGATLGMRDDITCEQQAMRCESSQPDPLFRAEERGAPKSIVTANSKFSSVCYMAVRTHQVNKFESGV